MLSTLTSKAQITLPKDVRNLLQLEPGDRVAFVPTMDGQMTVVKASKTSFSALRGILPAPARAYSVEEMDCAIQDAVAEAVQPKQGA